MRPAWAVALASMCTLSAVQGAEPTAFLFLKTGEKFATQEAAGQTVAAFTAYIAGKLGGVTFDPRVLNDPARAVEFATTKKPAVGIVTPGFYLAYAKQLGMDALLETRRENVPAERYVVVALKTAGEDLHGKTIATTLAKEERYVNAVILQGKFGDEVRLKAVTDVEGALFDLVDGSKNAADAVLVEDAAWNAIEKDEELSPKLKVAFTSDELPRNLVVLFRSNANGIDTEKLKSVLKDMGANDAGKQVLNSIRVETFEEVNKERLSKAEVRFHGK
jgi:ABC transporter, phosphonate, periplasmic substrate-binding protein